MRIYAAQISEPGFSAWRGRLAFTITETLVAGSVFLLAVGGVLIANTFGMRIVGITQPKLAASGEVRNSMAELISDIRSAKFVHIGNGNSSGFTNVAVGNPKQGNAIQLYTTADTNIFVRFYRSVADKKLKRMTNTATNATIVANAISNSIVFRAEDFSGNILTTNNQNNMVIAIALQYYELNGSGTLVGPNNYLDGSGTPLGSSSYYKSYSVTNRIAHRAY